MKRIKSILLSVAAIGALASCAKEISKAEAIEIAKGYEEANVIYKSGHYHGESIATFPEGFPDKWKNSFGGEGKKTTEYDVDDVASYRLRASVIENVPETNGYVFTFKADGKKLEMSYVLEQEHSRLQSTTYYDENGYPLGGNFEGTYTLKDGDRSFLVTLKTSSAYTWVK